MNTSIAHLPEEVQEKLLKLVGCIRKEVQEVQYIILYGSYARGNYVEYDQRIEYGIRTFFQSDFDIVILTSGEKWYNTFSILDQFDKECGKYAFGFPDRKVPPVEFLEESVEKFNSNIKDGLYFYTDIVKEGIILYNSGQYELEPVRELNNSQILNLLKKYYKAHYSRAEMHLNILKFFYESGDYEESLFELHQTTENYLLAIILTATLYSKKTHNIIEMLQKTASFTTNAIDVFHTETAEGRRLLKLLQSAYIQARYDMEFVVAKEDLDKLIVLIKRLKNVTKEFCLATIAEYERQAK